jgi:hypothetical protein
MQVFILFLCVHPWFVPDAFMISCWNFFSALQVKLVSCTLSCTYFLCFHDKQNFYAKASPWLFVTCVFVHYVFVCVFVCVCVKTMCLFVPVCVYAFIAYLTFSFMPQGWKNVQIYAKKQFLLLASVFLNINRKFFLDWFLWLNVCALRWLLCALLYPYACIYLCLTQYHKTMMCCVCNIVYVFLCWFTIQGGMPSQLM